MRFADVKALAKQESLTVFVWRGTKFVCKYPYIRLKPVFYRYSNKFFPRLAKRRHRIKKQKNIEVFRLVNDTLRSLDLKYWIEGGTCLGAIREGDFISFDLDIDFSIWNVENRNRVHDALLRAGFTLHKTYGTFERGYEESFVKNGVKVDTYYFYESGDFWYHGAGVGQRLLRFFPKRIFTELKEIDFYGKTFVPGRVEEFLTLRYGNWRVPNKKWDWETDPPCIRPITVLMKLGTMKQLKNAKKLGERLTVITEDPIYALSIKYVDQVVHPSRDVIERVNPDVYIGEENETTRRLGITVVQL